MAADLPTIAITQSGSPGSYSYAVTGSDSQGVNCPAFDISWGDAARFCNWLQNGQPTSGTEAAGTTETGAYTLNGGTSAAALTAVTRNAGATYFLPSENEWHKAAFYDPTMNGGAGGYWAWTTNSTTVPGNVLPDTGNNANWNFTDPTNYLIPVGAFVLSPGPYGTYDMGGDVGHWNDDAIGSSCRIVSGGLWSDWFFELGSQCFASTHKTSEYPTIDLRVASTAAVPEPGSLALLLAGAVALGIWRRRRKGRKLPKVFRAPPTLP